MEPRKFESFCTRKKLAPFQFSNIKCLNEWEKWCFILLGIGKDAMSRACDPMPTKGQAVGIMLEKGRNIKNF